VAGSSLDEPPANGLVQRVNPATENENSPNCVSDRAAFGRWLAAGDYRFKEEQGIEDAGPLGSDP